MSSVAQLEDMNARSLSLTTVAALFVFQQECAGVCVMFSWGLSLAQLGPMKAQMKPPIRNLHYDNYDHEMNQRCIKDTSNKMTMQVVASLYAECLFLSYLFAPRAYVR